MTHNSFGFSARNDEANGEGAWTPAIATGSGAIRSQCIIKLHHFELLTSLGHCPARIDAS
jgi:hypothetical protein